MKGFTEFRGYRSRVIYDPKSKAFLVRGVEYPDFDVGDAMVAPEFPSVNFIKQLKQRKSKSKMPPSAHKSVALMGLGSGIQK